MRQGTSGQQSKGWVRGRAEVEMKARPLLWVLGVQLAETVIGLVGV